MSGYLAGTIYGVSSVQTTLQQGMSTGQKVILPNGKECTLVQNSSGGSTIAKNAALVLSLASGALTVNATSAANTIATGVNDNANATIPAGSYFFMTERGLMYPLVAASVAAGAIVNPSGTSGTLAASTGTAAQQTNIQLLAASGTGGATAAYKS